MLRKLMIGAAIFVIASPAAAKCAAIGPHPAAALKYICDSEELRLTTAYIEELPPQYREALMLSRFEPLSTSEIAKKMGVSERTVQHYIVESLVYIRARLARGARPKRPRVEE